MRIDLDKEARRLEKERRGQFPELTTCIYRVTNPVFGRSLMQINARAMTGAVISRHKHNEQISIPTAQTVLHENDYIQAVGSDEALEPACRPGGRTRRRRTATRRHAGDMNPCC